jgi:hypothetical protein
VRPARPGGHSLHEPSLSPCPMPRPHALTVAKSVAMRKWVCLSADADPGTDRSRDTQKSKSMKNLRIALHVSATVSMTLASAPPTPP